MDYDLFVKDFTDDATLTFKNFEHIAKTYGIYFEKINNDIIVCYSGNDNPQIACLNFYKYFYPETKVPPKNFSLMSKINEIHKNFIKNTINNTYKKYDMPPRYDPTKSIHDNGVLLLNSLKNQKAIMTPDIEFIKYLLKFD